MFLANCCAVGSSGDRELTVCQSLHAPVCMYVDLSGFWRQAMGQSCPRTLMQRCIDFSGQSWRISERIESRKVSSCQFPVSSIRCTQLEKLRLEKPEVVERCSATAGLSLGECPLPFQKLACQNNVQLTVE